MKYYLDTEFIEAPNFIELISIGIKCEDGRTFYAESTCFDERKASQWVKENVISKLRFHNNPEQKRFSNINLGTPHIEVFGPLSLISDSVKRFVAYGKGEPEFWGYYADYDWVVFCWLFGSMVDLPKNFPMYCRDLKQLMDDLGETTKPEQENEHNALADAEWNESLHKFLNMQKNSPT